MKPGSVFELKQKGNAIVFLLLVNVAAVLANEARHSLNRITLPGCGRSKHFTIGSDRIVGGQNARHGQFPWIVSLQKKDDLGIFFHQCGGSILNENWILTAAHCVFHVKEPESYNVFVGLQKLTETNDPKVQRLKVSHIYMHEGFTFISPKDDVALLKTAQPIDIEGSDGYANGICLPESNQDTEAHATAIGWGSMGGGSSKSNTLQQVVLPIADRQACKKIYAKYIRNIDATITDKIICAGTKGKGTCHSDSGGPLFQTSSNGVSTIYGIASFGVGCGQYDDTPMVFTKVQPYLDWINDIVVKHS